MAFIFWDPWRWAWFYHFGLACYWLLDERSRCGQPITVTVFSLNPAHFKHCNKCTGDARELSSKKNVLLLELLIETPSRSLSHRKSYRMFRCLSCAYQRVLPVLEREIRNLSVFAQLKISFLGFFFYHLARGASLKATIRVFSASMLRGERWLVGTLFLSPTCYLREVEAVSRWTTQSSRHGRIAEQLLSRGDQSGGGHYEQGEFLSLTCALSSLFTQIKNTYHQEEHRQWFELGPGCGWGVVSEGLGVIVEHYSSGCYSDGGDARPCRELVRGGANYKETTKSPTAQES